MKHPEQKDSETFVTNISGESEWNRIGWKTKRRGSIAYDSNGNPISRAISGTVPVFVQRSEIEAVAANSDQARASALRSLLEDE